MSRSGKSNIFAKRKFNLLKYRLRNMKRLIVLGAFASMILAACNQDGKKAETMLDEARVMYENGQYAAAKSQIDSIQAKYPKELKTLRSGLTLMREVELKESERNIAFCDSMTPIKLLELDSLKRNFVFEKDSVYDEIGKYVSKQQTIEKNVKRCYIRSGVNEKGEIHLASVYYGGKPINHSALRLSNSEGISVETPQIPYDGGLNYRFKDMGNTTEVVTYQGEKCADAILFIQDNQARRIKAEFLGDKPYVMYIADADKKAISQTYELAIVLSDIETMRKMKDKSEKKIEYLKKKLGTKQE
jgi:hypothetical protein